MISYEGKYHGVYNGRLEDIYFVEDIINKHLKFETEIFPLTNVEDAFKLLSHFEHYEIEKEDDEYFIVIYTGENNADGGSELEIIESKNFNIAATLCAYETLKLMEIIK